MSSSVTPFTDTLTKLSRENAEALAALRHVTTHGKVLRDAIQGAGEQSRALRDAFQNITEENRTIHDAIRNMNRETQSVRDLFREMGETQRQVAAFVDEIRAPVDVFRKFREENAAMLEALELPRREFARLREESEKFRELLKPVFPTDFAELLRASDATSSLFRSIRENSEAVRLQGIKTWQIFNIARDVAADHRLSDWTDVFPAAQQFAAEAIERLNTVQSALDAVGLIEPPPTLAEPWRSIDDVEASFKKLPLHAQLIVLIVFVFFLKPLWDRAYTDYVLAEYGSSSVAPERATVVDVREVSEIAALRCVIADALNVRASASKAAERIGSLPRGHLVEVLDRDGAWSYVRYRHPDTDVLDMGWVATGYLSRELCPES